MITLDVPYIFDTLGGTSRVLALMDKHQPNHKVPYNTVQMWKNRSGIPAKWVGLILYVWLKQGHAGMAALTDSETL